MPWCSIRRCWRSGLVASAVVLPKRLPRWRKTRWKRLGWPPGGLAVIGIGPGDPAWRTPEASAMLAAADDIVGYRLYLDLLGRAIAGKKRHDSAIGAEEERVRLALDLAAAGRSVALVSSGDAGIYGLAALVFELVDREGRRDWSAVEIAVAP